MTHKREIFNIPNILSLSRIAASPLLIYLLIIETTKTVCVVTAVIFLIVCLTDWLDGYLARRLKLVTTLGKFLDPLADKLLIMTALIMLIPLGRAPAWMVAVILAREMAVTGLRAVAIEESVVISASNAGKAKTVSQIVAIVPLLLHYEFYGIDFHLLGSYVLWLALVLTVYSGVEYFYKFFRGGGGEGA